MSRHNHDPNYVRALSDRQRRDDVQGRASAATSCIPKAARRRCRAPSSSAVMTPINDADAPPPGTVGPDGISNGLYSIHIRMLDGIDGGNTGVMVLHDGNIRGGDAFFDYIGAYSSRERPLEGRDRQPRAYAEPGRAAGLRRPRGRHRLFRHLRRAKARKAKPPRSPASAASASRRCCGSWCV